MNTSIHTRTVVGLFDDYSTAQKAVEQLRAAGFTGDEIE
jgi:hypothetical protein